MGDKVTYTVVTRIEADKAVLATRIFNTLEEAIKGADIALFMGPRPVEVIVMDEAGIEISIRIFRNP